MKCPECENEMAGGGYKNNPRNKDPANTRLFICENTECPVLSVEIRRLMTADAQIVKRC